MFKLDSGLRQNDGYSAHELIQSFPNPSSSTADALRSPVPLLHTAHEVLRKLKPRREIAQVVPVHELPAIQGEQRGGIDDRPRLHVFDLREHFRERLALLQRGRDKRALLV